jgi:glucosamine kinase
MILIADSGSTKTDWLFMDGSRQIGGLQTKGFNPYYQRLDDMQREIEDLLLPAFDPTGISEIHFYGAGCSTSEKRQKIVDALLPFYKKSKISVQSDLIGAARAVSGNQSGIVCILGTGSGSCLYNGTDIDTTIPSLGFILGDEGSGAWLGKQMVTDYLRDHMPQKARESINKQFEIDKETILEHVNHHKMPSRYLGGFAQFISQHSSQTYFYHLLFEGFTEFANNYIVRYERYGHFPCHFVGSVAYYNQEILRQAARYVGFQIGNVIQSPIYGLKSYTSA